MDNPPSDQQASNEPADSETADAERKRSAAASVRQGEVRTNTYVDERAVTTASSGGDGWFGYLVGAVLALAAVAAVVVLFNADTTDESTMVARRPAPTEVPATPTTEPTTTPTVAPTAVPTVAPTAVPAATATPQPPAPTAVPLLPAADLAASTASLSSLSSALDGAGLTEAVRSTSPITVFAPTNAAFIAADLGDFTDDEINEILRYHVSEGTLSADTLAASSPFPTLTGEAITFADGELNGQARVLDTDIPAANGLVHTIDRVLIPASLERARAERALNELVGLDPIQFETASARILPDSEPILDEAIEVLSATEGAVEVEGHTDSRGGDASNQRLSQARAESVVAYLVQGGVDADRLEAIGYGETQLKIDPEATAEDEQMNRRIEFRLS